MATRNGSMRRVATGGKSGHSLKDSGSGKNLHDNDHRYLSYLLGIGTGYCRRSAGRSYGAYSVPMPAEHLDTAGTAQADANEHSLSPRIDQDPNWINLMWLCR